MKIIKKITVKQILTEKSKQDMLEKLTSEKAQLDLECQQLLFEQRKLMNKMSGSTFEIEQRFKYEIKQRKEKITLIEFKIEQLDLLELNSEIIEREIDALIDVSVGMNWDDVMKEQNIIVKDGVVVRIDSD